MFANQYAGYKPSGDGPVSLRCLLKVTNEDEIVLNAHWYSGKTYYNSFKAAGFQEIQLLHPSQWHIHDEVNTMNALERSLWTEFSNYNANCIAFSMTKN